ncbi:hypothetical protein SAMN05216319_1351 [Duganella sp. CF402]|uniref:hypothetical protein n=1 Tax=unclassified Duganella TaxID=2636909 RepID=UPI0008CA74F2|nr:MULTISPECIES: hypothetical protein [unclassified Duganella]RZT10196.1 hypothetical protein EV582_2274 [Duganella sp. BK701]SEL23844.1 hypothetical protein SAMN05216319_1351 [Duganella sp. CF402]
MVRIYDPGQLFDSTIAHLSLRNDRELCRQLQVAAPLLRKMRQRQLPISGVVLLRIHEITGISLLELRQWMGDRRRRFRLSSPGAARMAAAPAGPLLP